MTVTDLSTGRDLSRTHRSNTQFAIEADMRFAVSSIAIRSRGSVAVGGSNPAGGKYWGGTSRPEGHTVVFAPRTGHRGFTEIRHSSPNLARVRSS